MLEIERTFAGSSSSVSSRKTGNAEKTVGIKKKCDVKAGNLEGVSLEIKAAGSINGRNEGS